MTIRYIITSFLLFCTLGSFAQPPQLMPFPTPSNLRVVHGYNSISPIDCEYWNNAHIPESIITHLGRLTDSQENTVNYVTASEFCLHPHLIQQNGLQMSIHTGKFYFDGSSDIGIDTGIIMSTGTVKSYCSDSQTVSMGMHRVHPGISYPALYNSAGPNGTGRTPPRCHPFSICLFSEDPWIRRQYPELVALNNGDSIRDPNVVELDFIPKGNFISIDYVFASDEWPNRHCTGGENNPTADVMGIFLSGPGIVGQKNIAVLPGTNTPVTTRTIFPPNSPCHPPGNPSPYYIDNTNGQNIIFNGFTKVMTAASEVEPCQTYRIKIMVADGVLHSKNIFSNPSSISIDSLRWCFDSAILLPMGSLKSMDTIRIEAYGGTQATAATPYAARACFNGRLKVSAQKILPIDRTFRLHFGGTAQPGIDYQNIDTIVTIPAGSAVAYIDVIPMTLGSGNKTLEARIVSPYGSCSDWGMYLDSTTLLITDGYYPIVSPKDTTVCHGCNVPLQIQAEPQFSYQWQPATYLNQTNITNPISTPLQNIEYTINVIAPPNFPCQSSSSTVKINVNNVDIQDIENEQISLYPNPFKDGFVLKAQHLTGKQLSIQITDRLGRSVYQQKGTLEQLNNAVRFIGEKLEAGNYFIELQHETKTILRKQVVKY